jgi:hypothetical protein
MGKRNPKRKKPRADAEEENEEPVFDNVDFDEAEEADFEVEDDDKPKSGKAAEDGGSEDEDEDADGKSEKKSAEADEKPRRDFFQTLGDTFKSATQAAGKYARVGVSIAELEKLRLQLKMAHAKLGETLVQCWDDAPEIAVACSDPAVRIAYRRVKEIRRRIREIENRIRELQGGNKPAAKN